MVLIKVLGKGAMLSSYREDNYFITRALPILVSLLVIYAVLLFLVVPVNAVALAILL